MKRKLTALLLCAALVGSMIPAAGAAYTGDFEQAPAMALPEVRSSGLYDEPSSPLPEAAGRGFIREIEGWTPMKVASGLPVLMDAVEAGALPISSVEELQKMGPGSYYLTRDIDLTGVDWTPVDVLYGSVTLDGRGCSIRGLSLTSTAAKTCGFFGSVGYDLTVRNLRLEDVTFTVDCAAGSGSGFGRGALAGTVKGKVTLKNVVTSNLQVLRANTQGKALAGLVGDVGNGLTAEDCSIQVSISRHPDWVGTTEAGCETIAGLVALGDCTATRCYVQTNLDGADTEEANVGGLAGSGKLSATDCLITGTLKAPTGTAGGVSASLGNKPSLDNCVVDADLYAKNSAGGLLGYLNGSASLTDCRYTGSITCLEGGVISAGGLVGYLRGSLKAEGCAADLKVKTVGQLPAVTGQVGGLVGYTYSATYDFNRCTAALSDDNFRPSSIFLGGLVGNYIYSSTGTIHNCYALWDIPELTLSGDLYAGGLVARSENVVVINSGASMNFELKNAYPTGDARLGGLIGHAERSARISRSYATGSLKASWGGSVNETLDMAGFIASSQSNAGLSIGQSYSSVDLSAQFSGGTQNSHVGGLIGGGQNCMVYSSWSDAVVETTVPEGTDPNTGSGIQGGLIAYGRGTLMDSCFAGSMPSIVMGTVGGLVGEGITTMRNCYTELNLSGGGLTGGLVGYSKDITCSDCRFEGTIEDTYGTVGGILGAGIGTILRCRTDATLSAPDRQVGGIVGDLSGTVDSCSFWGTVAGTMVGGIAGYATTVRNSTVRGTVDIAFTEGEVWNFFVGGIVGKGRWIHGCTMQSSLCVDFALPEAAGAYQHLGGIVGSTERSAGRGAVTNCTSMGISVYASEGNLNFNVGGIVGEGGSDMDYENCRVMGKVHCTNPIGYVYVGGIAGLSHASNFKSCSSSGVSGYSSDAEKATGPVYAGGVVGWATSGTYKDIHASRGSANAARESVPTRAEHNWVGVGVVQEEYIPSPDYSGREDDEYIIRTFWHPENSLSMVPLEGAQVLVDGAAAGVTNDEGTLVLKGADVTGSIVTLSAEMEGYFGAEQVTYLAKGGTTHLFLEKKTPGKIYLRSALVESTYSQRLNMLYRAHSLAIFSDEEEPRSMYFGVDWNDMQEISRTLLLKNQDGSRFVHLEANQEMNLALARYFVPGDELTLVASAFDQEGKEVKVEHPLDLKIILVKPSASVITESFSLGDEDGRRGIDVLAGFRLGFSLGDLFGYSGIKLTYKDHTFTAEFTPQSWEVPAIEMIGTQAKLSISGSLTAIENQNPSASGSLMDWLEWSGGEVTVSANLDPLAAYAPPPVPRVPVTFYARVGATATASVGLSKMLRDPTVTGKISLGADASFTAGPGFSLDEDWFIVLGPRLGAEGSFNAPVSVSKTELEEGAYGEFSGALDVALVGKAGSDKAELDAGFQLGGFKWNSDEGAVFYALGQEVDRIPNEPEAVSSEHSALQSIHWTPISQSYLLEGGGFVGEGSAELLSWNNTPTADEHQANVQQLYENILLCSFADLTAEGDTLVLYFTADDGKGDTLGVAADHTLLWRTQQQTDGSWSTPTPVSQGGYPDNVDADGAYVVWVESTETGSLDELMASTQLRLAKEGTVAASPELEAGYITAPRVSSSVDGKTALVTWLSEDEDGHSILHYGLYNSEKDSWSTGIVNTGNTTARSARPRLAQKAISWQGEDGMVYVSTGSSYQNPAAQMPASGKSDHLDNYSAAISDGSILTIWNKDVLEASIATRSNYLLQPILLCDDGVYYVVWVQSDGIYYADSRDWSQAKQICAEDQLVSGLSAAIVDGRPRVTYYRSDYNADNTGFVRHLYTALAPDLSGVDLAVETVTLEDDFFASDGLVEVSGVVTNLGLDEVDDFTYTITDDTGATLYTGEVTDAALGYGHSRTCAALIPGDGQAARTYTFTVAAEGDKLSANNANSVTGQAEAALLSCNFVQMPSGATGLEAIAGNSGAAPLEDMTVELFRCNTDGDAVGQPLVSQRDKDILPGSNRQVVLPQTDMDTYYKVVLSSDGAEVDSQMLMWTDPATEKVWMTDMTFSQQGDVTVDLSARDWTQALQLHLALYQNGRMVTSAVEYLDSWTGSRQVEHDFGDYLSTEGIYTCSAMLVQQVGFTPVCEKKTADVVVPAPES